MNIPRILTRSAGALAAAAAVVSLATVQTASAAPARTATTTSYSNATYLQHVLGLPTTDTDPVIEPVTYDRFQWLLQQSGNFAVLIGDPAEDATFANRAQDVEVAAKAAGVKTVYWFDPNLSGSAQVGTITEPALDIRDASGISSLVAASQTKYDDAWSNLVGLYLGNGITVTPDDLNSESATVEVTKGTATINDNGGSAGHSTKVGDTNGGALYDYTSGSAPSNVTDSFFFIYNKANTDGGQPAKVVSWTDLTTQASSTPTQADVTTAITTVGSSQLAAVDQFAWWKSEVNAKQVTQASSSARGADVPVLTDADNADGWRVNQLTYPELVDLLKHATTANAVILFGGTWCPNTRPVLPSINKYAQQNDVNVYNFDTVLDGGLVGGATTSGSNPLQSRNTTASGSSTAKANPSFVYGDLVSQYLNNVNTQYDYTTGGPAVTYYANGGTAGSLTSVRKLQVPFLIGYQGVASTDPHGGVDRQWIIKKDDNTYTEYMSQWWYTNPQANQLGITTIPLDAPIWSTINAQLANVTWQTDPSTLYPNTAADSDDADYLVGADTATVTYTAASGGTPASVTVSSGGGSPIGISPAALSAALAAVGASAPANLAAAKTALIAAETASTPDSTLISNLSTIVGAWGVAQSRKTKVISTWGNATSPGSVAGGLAAVHALDVFFGGLPGGVVSRRTVTADPVTSGTAPKITIAIANDYGRVPTGDVSLVVKKGGATVASASCATALDAASFTLPVLDAGTYDYTLSYAGDDQLAAFTETGSLTVSPTGQAPVVVPTPTPGATPPPVTKPGTPAKVARTKASKVKGVIAKAPTSKTGGRYKVTITTPKGASAASGKVTIKLKKGKTTKTVTGKLSHGVVTVSLPKLARGTWKVTISWPGDAHYLTTTVAGPSIKVIK
jgi:thiol-disulfide isomerase/thioredoxin